MSEEYNEEDYEQEVDGDLEETEEQKPKKSSRILLIVFVLLLAGLNVFLGYNIFQQKEELEAKKAAIIKLEKTRDSLNTRIDAMTSEIGNLQDSLSTKDATLASLMTELSSLKEEINQKDEKLKNLDYFRRKAAAVDRLNSQLKEREEKIKELQKELEKERSLTKNLQNAQDTLTQRLNELEGEKSDLENKVELGQQLKADLVVYGMKERNFGNPRETDRANQVNMFDIKYTVEANKIALKGNKTAYIVVKNGNTTITKEGQVFDLKNGKSIAYTISDQFTYDGNEILRATLYKLKEDEQLSPGKYSVEIYIDGTKVGDSSFSLR